LKRHLLNILFLALLINASAQKSEIKNLVFEGAGVRGIAYVGAIKSLEKHDVLKGVEKVGGTSAGAITALLLAVGYTPDEMEVIISNTKLQKFNDGRMFFIGGFFRTKNRYGWYRGQKFTRWIGELIKAKTGNADITFEKLHQKGFKDLYITATCLNQQKLLILSYETFPNMKIKDAVRASMSIPLYYQAVFMDSTGKTYVKQNREHSLNILVDGGIIGNFPIQIFDSVNIDSSGAEHRIPNFQTLGVRIDSDTQIKENNVGGKIAPYRIENFADYVSAFYAIIMETLNRYDLTKEDWGRTVSISSVGITPKVKRLSKDEKALLIQSGWDNTNKYFNK
jgi:NTE family protein